MPRFLTRATAVSLTSSQFESRVRLRGHLRADDVQDAGHAADDERSPGVDGGAAAGDGHQTRQGAVAKRHQVVVTAASEEAQVCSGVYLGFKYNHAKRSCPALPSRVKRYGVSAGCPVKGSR